MYLQTCVNLRNFLFYALEIFDCSSPDLKIEKLVDEILTEPGKNQSSEPKEKALDETFTEPGNKHPSGHKEKVLDETFTEPGSKHYSGPKEKTMDETFTKPDNTYYSVPKEEILDEAFTEPRKKHSSDHDFKIAKVLDDAFIEPDNKHSSDPEMKPEDITPLCEDDHVYEVIPFDDFKTNNQSSYQDSLLSGNNYGTIPLSQCHALSNCKIANMGKKNPDPGNSMYDEPDSFYNQYENDFSMGLPSTQKSEEMVAVGKPKIRSPDIGGPCDIKTV